MIYSGQLQFSHTSIAFKMQILRAKRRQKVVMAPSTLQSHCLFVYFEWQTQILALFFQNIFILFLKKTPKGVITLLEFTVKLLAKTYVILPWRGAWHLKGEYLKVVWAEFLTLSCAALLLSVDRSQRPSNYFSCSCLREQMWYSCNCPLIILFNLIFQFTYLSQPFNHIIIIFWLSCL